MAETMKGYVFKDVNDLRLEDRPIPTIQDPPGRHRKGSLCPPSAPVTSISRWALCPPPTRTSFWVMSLPVKWLPGGAKKGGRPRRRQRGDLLRRSASSVNAAMLTTA